MEAGLGRVPLPSDAGGFGADLAEAAQVVAAVAAVDGSIGLGYAMHVHVVGSAVESSGWRPAARDRLLAAVRDGALVNNAATEEAGGSPARGAIPETIAEPDGAGYRLTGEKTWTTWLPALRLAVVSARLAEPLDGASPRVGAFVVDLESAGVSRLPAFDALGMRGSASGRLIMDGVRVAGEDVAAIRASSEPDPRGPSGLAWFGIVIGATYLGIGEGARKAVVRWAIDRRPGDRSTAVADIPSIQVRLGRLDAELRAARSVLLEVARRWSATPADGRGAVLGDVGLAKLLGTSAAVRSTDEALRIAGGPGFLAGHLERAFRDARAGLINPPLEDVAYQGFARTLFWIGSAGSPIRRGIMPMTYEEETRRVPPVTELTRIEPIYLERLEKQGIFTTGILLEVSETPARRQYLADHADADPNDVLAWRDEALMLNLAAFGPTEHRLMLQAGIHGINGILAVDLETLKARLARAAAELKIPPPEHLTIEGWWEQARTLDDTIDPNRTDDAPGADVYGALLRFAVGAVIGGSGAVIAALATGFGSVAIAIGVVAVVMLATGAIARYAHSGLATFIGLLLVSGVLLLVLGGRSVGIDGPVSIHGGIGPLVGLPGVFVGYVAMWAFRSASGSARPAGRSRAPAGANR